MNGNLRSRLLNYQFEQAEAHLEGEDEKTRDVVHALAETFGDVGLLRGTIRVIVDAALIGIGL